jgi:thiol:disulfide interchange protein DsbD
MAASFFGAFELALPQGLQNKLSDVGGVGYKGAFLLGLVSALVATPCTGPFLTSLLVWIAESQNTLLGAVMMGAFALGLGAPFFVVGAFAMQLPKGGKWMVHVKTGFGVVLLIGALYYLGSAFPVIKELAPGGLVNVGAFAAVALLGVAALLFAAKKSGWASVASKIAGVAAASVGAYLAVAAAMKPPPPEPGSTVAWQKISITEARAQALTDAKPMLVDFTAQWCIACGELDKFTFSRPEVAGETKRFVAIKIDMTDDEDPIARQSSEGYAIRGLPTVLMFDSAGNEAVRCTDFVPAEEFLEFARGVN